MLSVQPRAAEGDAPSSSGDTIHSYFDMKEVASQELARFPKWTGMVLRKGLQHGWVPPNCTDLKANACPDNAWQKMLEQIKGLPRAEQIEAVNDWANKHPYISDQMNWGMSDFWQTPYEFTQISGDCEDYAIVKYYSLRALGVPASDMRIMVLQDLNLGGIIHAVLGVYQNGQLSILDNQIKQVMPALSIYHYRPVYGINEDAWWAYQPRKQD